MNLVTATQVDPAIATFYDKVLLKRGLPYIVHERFAKTRPIATRSGNTIKFRRYGRLAPALTPLVEGVTPAGKMITKTDITARLKQYGDYVHHTDVVSLTNQDAVLTEIMEVLGEQSGETHDILARDVYVAGSNVYYAGSVSTPTIDTRVEVNAEPKTEDMKKIREIMVGNKAKRITTVMKASVKQGTMAVPPSYFGIVHHELQNDLEALSGWLAAHNYPNSMPSTESEIGAHPDSGTRFLITQNGKYWPDAGGATGAGTTYRSDGGANCNVYAMLIFAQDAVARVPLSGQNLKSIVKAVGSSGSSDPLDQRGSAGWKSFLTWSITNDLWLIRGEFCATL